MRTRAILDDADAREIARLRGLARRPPPPLALVLPAGLIASAQHHLRSNGREELEQLVLWAGYPDGDRALITSLLMPETVATWGSVTIVRSEFTRIADWLFDRGQLLFVEMHTHGSGPRATELSLTDRAYPIGRQAGFVTVIVPGYAASGISPARCGVWEYCPPEWVPIARRDVPRRISVCPDESVRDALGR